jgi:hypothetical protein
MISRRELLKIMGLAPGFSLLKRLPAMAAPPVKPETTDPQVFICRSLNGLPVENMEKVIDLAGGIVSYVSKDDIVVIKPNVQWWNQGAPNLGALYTFIKLIMERPDGFSGEVVIAENCHRGDQPWNSAGWSHTFERNTSISSVQNYNDLTKKLKQDFGDRYSTVHWVNVHYGANRVFSPEDGPGYVYCDGTGGVPKIAFGNGASGDGFRETIMTYPIFKTDRGTIVDYKNGIWENGEYDNNRLKVINFAALNHHSAYCGITSLIKNYLGVSDLSGGPDPFDGGKLTDRYYNFHSFPFNKWAPGPQPGMIGAEIGVFLNTIRKADLHVVTAEWIGLADRIEPPLARTRAVLASTDPVALDFHSAKYLLYANSGLRFHNPEALDSPTHQYIKACGDHGGGIFDESKVALVSYDHKFKRLQRDDEAAIVGEKKWGTNPKALGKYMLMRYGAFLL